MYLYYDSVRNFSFCRAEFIYDSKFSHAVAYCFLFNLDDIV